MFVVQCRGRSISRDPDLAIEPCWIDELTTADKQEAVLFAELKASTEGGRWRVITPAVVHLEINGSK